MKTIKLPCFGIVITLGDGVNSITDDLHEHLYPENAGVDDGKYETSQLFNNMIDGITSMILAHACAGIDVTSPAYIEGIEVAVEACTQYAYEY